MTSLFRDLRAAAVLEFTPALIVPLGGAVILGSGPVDYRWFAWLATAALVAVIAVLMPLCLLRHARRKRRGAAPDNGEDLRWAAKIIVSLELVVLAAAGIRAAERGVIWPSTPTAAHVTAACPALQAAGLDRIWPADSRTRDDKYPRDIGDNSYCHWLSRAERPQPAPYTRLSAVVRRHKGVAMFSAPAMAVSSYDTDRAAQPSPVPTPGLGDQAFVSSTDNVVLVEARRSNVTVAVSITLYPGVNRTYPQWRDAETAARTLTTAILAAIRLG